MNQFSSQTPAEQAIQKVIDTHRYEVALFEGQVTDQKALAANEDLMAEPMTKLEVNATIAELERHLRIARFLLAEAEGRMATLQRAASGG